MVRHLIVILLLLLFTVASSTADVFTYSDKDGTTHFVDDISKIPKKYRKQKRVIEDEASDDANSDTTSVRVIGNQVLVPATLYHNGKKVRATFLLDTGASSTTISDSLAEKLGIDVQSGKQMIGQVVGGGLLLVSRVAVDRIDVGPKSRSYIDVDVIEHSGSGRFDGLLGMNYLRNYHYVIDFRNGLIRWQ